MSILFITFSLFKKQVSYLLHDIKKKNCLFIYFNDLTQRKTFLSNNFKVEIEH